MATCGFDGERVVLGVVDNLEVYPFRPDGTFLVVSRLALIETRIREMLRVEICVDVASGPVSRESRMEST